MGLINDALNKMSPERRRKSKERIDKEIDAIAKELKLFRLTNHQDDKIAEDAMKELRKEKVKGFGILEQEQCLVRSN